MTMRWVNGMVVGAMLVGVAACGRAVLDPGVPSAGGAAGASGSDAGTAGGAVDDPCLNEGGDADGDGVCQAYDNCSSAANPDQADVDGDRIGDACDPLIGPATCDGNGGDSDKDDVCQSWDNCPDIANPDQKDSDGDGAGDLCDPTPGPCDDHGGDSDLDAWCNDLDNCPDLANANQLDRDQDGIGDACDPFVDPGPGPCTGLGGDDDGDDYCGVNDNCPAVANPSQSDLDADGIGDACDTETCDGLDNDGDGSIDEGFADSDQDGVADCADRCPGIADADADADGVIDCEDPCPHDAFNDPDRDQICNDVDNCPNKANYSQGDSDEDGIGDACDVETCDGIDNDGDNNVDEGMPDGDGDGTCDSIDACPNDPNNDVDGDGVCGDQDNCNGVWNPDQDNADGDAWGDACDIDTTAACGQSVPLFASDAFHLDPGPFKYMALSTDGKTLFLTRGANATYDPNQLIAFDLATSSLLWKMDVGTDPGQIVVAPDGSRLYIALDGDAAVRVVSLPRRAACFEFPLGSSSSGLLYAGDMGVLPSYPETLVVSTRLKNATFDFGGVFVYDNGAVRPEHTAARFGSRALEVFSDSVAYGLDNSRSDPTGLHELAIDDQGIKEKLVQNLLVGGLNVDILASGQRIYTTNGAIIDPVNVRLFGLVEPGVLAVDETRREEYVWITARMSVEVVDIDRIAYLRSITLTNLKSVGQVLRFGSSGLIVRHADGLTITTIL
jgi:hypothetical protein